MNVEKLERAFSEFKKVEGVDFSIYDADKYGDCNTCVWSEIGDEFGAGISKGIWLKHWFKGGNREKESMVLLNKVFIAHRLDKNLAKEFYKIFSKDYIISPEEWDDNKCFILIEK